MPLLATFPSHRQSIESSPFLHVSPSDQNRRHFEDEHAPITDLFDDISTGVPVAGFNISALTPFPPFGLITGFRRHRETRTWIIPSF
ncbi:hypothetical protein J3R74_002877 [Puniceicoccus vermicola]